MQGSRLVRLTSQSDIQLDRQRSMNEVRTRSHGRLLTEDGDGVSADLGDLNGPVGGVAGDLQVPPRPRRHRRRQVGGRHPAAARRQVNDLSHLKTGYTN